MNKFTQNLFQWVYPFFPLWAWLTLTFAHFPAEKILVIILLPLLVYTFWTVKMKVPAYLIFYISFTVFHLCSVFYNGLMPDNTNWVFFILFDSNTLATILFLIVENTDFDEGFLKKMGRHILWIVALSLVFSILQIKDSSFFYNISLDEDLIYLGDGRNTSIYSWLGLNSIGVTFPILVSILLNVYNTSSRPFPLIVLAGIVVAFLTKARYVMISTIIAFLQLFFIKSISIKKKVYVIVFFVVGIFMILGVSQLANYDINATINDRILEKDGDMQSAKTRLLSYDVFMMKFPENPYFGVGPKTRADVVNLLGGEAPIIHVGYLSYLYFYGFFGAMLLFIALACLLWDAWLIGRRDDFWGSFYGLLGFALANFTFVYFNFSEMGITLAVIYMRYYKVNSIRL